MSENGEKKVEKTINPQAETHTRASTLIAPQNQWESTDAERTRQHTHASVAVRNSFTVSHLTPTTRQFPLSLSSQLHDHTGKPEAVSALWMIRLVKPSFLFHFPSKEAGFPERMHRDDSFLRLYVNT